MSIPSEIASYLIPNETILKEWSTRDWNIYATQQRIFLIKRGFLSKQVVEASYAHISSIKFMSERRFGRLVVAILLFILSFVSFRLDLLIPPELISEVTLNIGIILGGSFILLGGGLLIWFVIGVDEFFTLYVVGREPITVSKELSDMIRFVREKRVP